MVNWSEVPHDLLEFIAKRIYKHDDFVRFGAVCKSWHAAAEKKNFKGLREHIPYMMLAAEGDERGIYSLSEHEIVAKVTLPCLRGKKCIESLGWLLIVGREGDMSLLNPLTGFEIELPNYKTFPEADWQNPIVCVRRMVLTSRPDKSSDYVVMVLAGHSSLAFWRPEDNLWNSLEKLGYYRDVTYFNGKFYAIDNKGFVMVFDLAGPKPRLGQVLTCVELGSFIFMLNLYIVKFSGTLLVIARDAKSFDHVEKKYLFDTDKFHLLKVDTSSGRCEKIHSLGSKAAFVGHSATTLVETSKFHEFKANHIYYTLDCWYLIDLGMMGDPENCCKDIGVYNVETEDVERFYDGDEGKLFSENIEPFYDGNEGKLFSEICQAVWFTPHYISPAVKFAHQSGLLHIIPDYSLV